MSCLTYSRIAKRWKISWRNWRGLRVSSRAIQKLRNKNFEHLPTSTDREMIRNCRIFCCIVSASVIVYLRFLHISSLKIEFLILRKKINDAIIAMEDGALSNPIREVRIPTNKRDLISFWIFGLCNNFGYVVMLTAAMDIINSNDVSYKKIKTI